MEYLPLFTRVRGECCLLVGSGGIALRKGRLLSKAGARIRCISETTPSPELLQLIEQNGGEFLQQAFDESALQGVRLAVVAISDLELATRIAERCAQLNLPVNVVDRPDLCSFIFPAMVDRSPLLIAVSSSGSSPVLARQLRNWLESTLPAAYGALADLMGGLRDKVAEKIPSEQARRLFWEAVAEGPEAEMALAGRRQDAERAILDRLEASDGEVEGEVYLVGAGPGDPDLLTLKALRLMQKADVVLYDALVSPAIVDRCRRDAERIYVGKRSANHAMPQDSINQQLLTLAQQGLKVLRLKGGDPFVFGRGGEEITLLAEHGVPFQVVPGISAANGCASYAGIPLTHRDYAQSVRLITAHLKDGSIDLPWQELVKPGQTLVFYMGLANLRTLCEQMVAHGRSPDTPMALVEKGTTAEQRVIVATLGTLASTVEGAGVKAPTLLILGEVVALREKLNWFQGL